MTALIALAAFALQTAQQSPAKWRVTFADGYAVTAPTREQARNRAQSLTAGLELGATTPEPALDSSAPSVPHRIAEETTSELLDRLAVLQAASESTESGVRTVANSTLNQVRQTKPTTAQTLTLLNAGIERVALQQALAALDAKREPNASANAALIAEPLPISTFDNVPVALRPGLVALLERLEGLRAMPVSQPALGRDTSTKRLMPAGATVRLSAEPATSTATNLSLRIRLTARNDSSRVEIVVIDRYARRNGTYVLTGSAVSLAPAKEVGGAVAAKILESARTEHARMLDRLERQRVAAEKDARERDEADRAEKAQLQREEDQRRLEQQQREEQEKQQREADEKRAKVEQYKRDLEDASRSLDQARDSRESSQRDLDRARNNKRDADSEKDRAKERRDSLRDRLHDAERKLEDARKDGKGTSALENVVSELKDQVRGAESDYDHARDRAESESQRIRELESSINDLESRMRNFSSEIDDIRLKIAQLGG